MLSKQNSNVWKLHIFNFTQVLINNALVDESSGEDSEDTVVENLQRKTRDGLCKSYKNILTFFLRNLLTSIGLILQRKKRLLRNF